MLVKIDESEVIAADKAAGTYLEPEQKPKRSRKAANSNEKPAADAA